MAMITEDFVSFKTANLLKEKGFNEETEYVYSDGGELLRLSHLGIKDLTNADCNDYHTWQFPIEGVASIISAPTLQMAMKWLREVHNIAIVVAPSMPWGKYNVSIYKKGNDYPYGFDGGDLVPSYEQAVNAAIKYCLEHLLSI